MSVSIRDIASRTGLSPATVSLALRGTGRISEATRARVRAAAAEMGYEAHPLLSHAFSIVRHLDKQCYKETLALILEYPSENGPDYQQEMHAAARERAADLGYKLEAFIVSGKPEEHRKLSKILYARGIRGIIIHYRLEHAQPRLHLDFAKFAAVEMGRSLWFPPNLHRVELSDYPVITEVLHLLKKVGYRRIGLAIEPMQAHHQRGAYQAAYLLMQQRLPGSARLPIYAIDGKWDFESFRDWIQAHRPDVVICHKMTDICTWLDSLGLRIPEDISIFNTSVRRYDNPGLHQNYDWSGNRHDTAGMGRRAVEMVANFLRNSEMGLNGSPICLQVSKLWVSGSTLSRSIAKHVTPEGFLRVKR